MICSTRKSELGDSKADADAVSSLTRGGVAEPE